MLCRYRRCRPARKPLVSLRVRLRPRRTVLPLRARVMTVRSLRLGVPAHHADVLLGHDPRLDDDATQLALALAGLVAQQVLLAGLAPLQLAVGRHAEALLRCLMSLHLGHTSPVSTRPGRTRRRKKKGALG